jgi:hypothetical protein
MWLWASNMDTLPSINGAWNTKTGQHLDLDVNKNGLTVKAGK